MNNSDLVCHILVVLNGLAMLFNLGLSVFAFFSGRPLIALVPIVAVVSSILIISNHLDYDPYAEGADQKNI